MKFRRYIKDHLFFIFIYLFMYSILLLLFFAFKSPKPLIVAVSVVLFVSFLILFLMDYFRKKNFYKELLFNIDHLDQSYLVLETLKTPTFYEGELIYQALYEINKSMIENVKSYEDQMNAFKDYVEMWIHEVKIPLSSLMLLHHNHKDSVDRTSIEQEKRIDEYLEQILYYVRSENAEKDYLIKENDLASMIRNVALKNKDDLLEHQIDFLVEDVCYSVFTDAKWFEFILNQIINNSMKYKKDKDAYIKLTVKDERNRTVLIIEDNGIGIPSSDLPRVFDKSFTGSNGRRGAKSTGMGLFIVKNLCTKLGHLITIESEEGQYTKIYLTFFKNQYYEVVR